MRRRLHNLLPYTVVWKLVLSLRNQEASDYENSPPVVRRKMVISHLVCLPQIRYVKPFRFSVVL